MKSPVNTHSVAFLRHYQSKAAQPIRRALPMAITALFSSAILGLSLQATSVSALSLGEPTLRSFLGESLDVSLPLMSSAENEDLTSSCFVLQRVSGDETYLHGREIKLSVAEIRGSKRLRVQSIGPISEPVVRLRMRATCGGGTQVRDYALLLDPPPQSLASIAPSSIAAPTVLASEVSTLKPSAGLGARSPGVWVAREGDSMTGIASGLFPKSKRNQGRYVAALRNTNPNIAGYAASAPLPPGTNVALPDLRSLPQSSARPNPLDLPEKPVNRAPSTTSAVESKASESGESAAALKPKRDRSNKESTKTAQSATQSGTKPKASAKAPGFSLKLSGGDVDTSRSTGVTEEARVSMRQKQLLLDADDQVAALLTLGNSVQRLEKRLDAMQGRPPGSTAAENAQAAAASASKLPSGVAAVATPATAAANTAPTSTEAGATANIAAASAGTTTTAATTPAVDANAVGTPSVSTGADTKTVKPAVAKPTKASAPKQPSIADEIIANWPLWLGGAVIAAGLLALALANRRRKAVKPTYRIEENTLLRPTNDRDETDPEIDTSSLNLDEATNSIDNTQGASFEARKQSAEALLRRATPAAGMPGNTQSAATSSALDTDAEMAFDLDPKPLKSNSTLHNRGLNSPESRVRRLKYMAERFPELGSGTVSIDDSASVINAARLYYDEKQADKAIELLTFGVEERPQQLALWLALFEVYRLENMAVPFTELATKFHVLFASSPEWPKVRHIGYELNPYEHLFAEAVEGVLMGESPFDSMQDNWLNAPVDMSSHYFAQQLRQNLFNEFNVLPGQLDFSPNVIEAAGSQ